MPQKRSDSLMESHGGKKKNKKQGTFGQGHVVLFTHKLWVCVCGVGCCWIDLWTPLCDWMKTFCRSFLHCKQTHQLLQTAKEKSADGYSIYFFDHWEYATLPWVTWSKLLEDVCPVCPPPVFVGPNSFFFSLFLSISQMPNLPRWCLRPLSFLLFM